MSPCRMFRFLICLVPFVALWTGGASAQFMPNLPAPYREVTSDGIDPMTGALIYSNADIATGSAEGPGPLTLVRTYDTANGTNYAYTSLGNGFTHNFQIYLEHLPIDGTDSVFKIVLGSKGYSFDYNNNTHLATSKNGDGAQLLSESTGMVLLLKDGTRIDFGNPYTSIGRFYIDSERFFNWGATSITYPNGEFILLKYEIAASTTNDGTIHRLSSVVNSNGYSLGFSYLDPASSGGINQEKFLVSRITADRVSCVSQVTDCNTGAGAYVDYNYTLLSTLPDGQKVYGLTKYTAADGKYVNYDYDAGWGLSAVRRNGSATPDLSVSHPTPGTTWFTDGDGKVKKYAFQSQQYPNYTQQTTITDASGVVTKMGGALWDMRPVWTENGLGQRTEYSYDIYGRLLSTKYPEGNSTELVYDSRGNVTEKREKAKPNSGLPDVVTSAAFPACTAANAKICNKPTHTIDAKGNRTDYQYDPVHGEEIVTLSPPNQANLRTVTRHGYSSFYPAPGVLHGGGVALPSAWLLTATDECLASSVTGTTIDFTYICPAGSTVRRSLVYTASSSGARASHELERVVEDATGLALTTSYTYLRNGKLGTEDGAQTGSADTVAYNYDAAGRRIETYHPNAGSTAPRQQFVYDASGRLQETKRKLAAGWVSETSTFNGRGLIASQTAFDGTTITYTYDDAGRLKDETVATTQPRTTRRIYDDAGMLTKIQRGVGTPLVQDYVTYSYTLNGQIASERDANGNVTTRCYDGFDRLLEQRFPAPVAAPAAAPDCAEIVAGGNLPASITRESYGHDANGNLTSLRLRDGQLLTFSYDALDRVILKTVPGVDRSVTSIYDLLGRRTSANLPGGNAALSVSWTYDNADRVKTATSQGRTLSYNYDPSGSLIDTVWPDGSTARYTVDAIDRITSVVEPNVMALVSYQYDQLSRRTAKTNGSTGTTTYTYDGSQRLGTLSHDLSGTAADIDLSYTYNSAGQIATKAQSNDAYVWNGFYNVNRPYTRNALNQYVTAGPATFSYDLRGNLTGDGTWTFGYDAENHLISGSNGSNVGLAYDAIGRLARVTSGSMITTFLYDGENLIGEYDGAGTLLRRTAFGAGEDEPTVIYEGGARSWLYSNEQRSIIARADAAGSAITIATYGHYGESDGTGRFGYTGQIRIPELGLYYYKSRFYSPYIGRFLQPDPIGTDGGMNLYEYAASDPINMIDPTGHAPGEQSSTEAYEPGNEDEITVVGRRLREGTSLIIGFTPLGFPADVYTAISGKDGITGERVSGFWRVAGLIPYVSEARKGFNGARAIVRVAKGCGCFEAGTLVSTPSGMRPIEQIKVGDEVLAGDEATGKIFAKKVTDLIRPAPKPIYELRLKAPAGDIVTFRVTDDHPWKVEGKGWVETINLLVGQNIDTASGADMVVEALTLAGGFVQTYNLTVADLHTFFVGKDKVWVHNANCFTTIANITAKGARVKNQGLGMSSAKFVQNLKGAGYSERALSNGAIELTRQGSNIRYVVRPSDSVGTAADVYVNGVNTVKYGFTP
jgi:RHS repeat-associated protein